MPRYDNRYTTKANLQTYLFSFLIFRAAQTDNGVYLTIPLVE